MSNNTSSYSSFSRFLTYAKPWRGKIILSSTYSILNKLFDIAPEILIGIAVDLVVQKNDSIIAKLGFESIGAKKLSALVLGFRISKRQQVSNWEMAKLSQAQINYAATDAWICREIYLRLT